MVRLGAIFVAICMVLIAGSIGAVLYLYFGLSGAEVRHRRARRAHRARVCTISVSSRLRDRGDFGAHIADLSRGTADLARQVAELGRRVAAVEARTDAAVDKAFAATKPLRRRDRRTRARLVKQLAESVAAHDAGAVYAGPASRQSAPPAGGRMRLSRLSLPTPAAPLVSPAATFPTGDTAKGADRAELGEPEFAAAPTPAGRFKGMDRDAVVGLIREAVEANRVDLYLQPIVTLPQRKVRFYEAMARLRTRRRRGAAPGRFPSLCRERRIDAQARQSDACSAACRWCAVCSPRTATSDCSAMSPPRPWSTPNSSRSSPSSWTPTGRSRPALVFEFKQAGLPRHGPDREREPRSAWPIAASASRWIRSADLRFEPRDLAERGFRFIKVPASMLLNRTGAAATRHPSGRFRRACCRASASS